MVTELTSILLPWAPTAFVDENHLLALKLETAKMARMRTLHHLTYIDLVVDESSFGGLRASTGSAAKRVVGVRVVNSLVVCQQVSEPGKYSLA